MKITFLPDNLTCEYKKGETLLDIALRAGVYVDVACGGNGICGKCQMKVTHPDGITEIQRACKYYPEGDLIVETTGTSDASKRKEQLLTLVKRKWFPESCRRQQDQYGLAFDIGSTTVVGMLWDFWKESLVDVTAESNPQTNYGADVISRILYASESEENLQKIHNVIIDCMNQMIDRFILEHSISRKDIRYVTVVGNTTMSHLFLGINPVGLARAPFNPEFKGPVEDVVTRVGLKLDSDVRFLLLPNIAGHVGSDITAGIVASNMVEPTKNNMLIDIGTNGEIALAAKGKIYVCSTAAGPAFEGAVIKNGMRAASGAIEAVKPGANGVLVRTINNVPPIGICGSGLIDAVATLLHMGIINGKGKMDFALAGKNGLPEEREYILAQNGTFNVTISQNDVREMQLAKGAMRAGMEVLLDTAGLTWDDLDRFYIAGAFGSYVDVESAIAIGLLPDLPKKKIASIGNAAGAGALMALVSVDAAKNAEELVKEATHIELSNLRAFEERYYAQLMFPATAKAQEKKKKRLSRREQAQKTEENIFNAAIELFNEKGYEKTSIEDITSRAGTATGTFYLYFRSKKELVYHTVGKYNDVSLNAYERVKDLPTFQEQIQMFAKYVYEGVEKLGRELLKALYWNNLTEGQQVVNDPNRSIYSRLDLIVRHGLETGELSPEHSVEYYTRRFVIAFLGIDYYWASMPGDVDLKTVVEQEFKTLVYGMLNSDK